MNEPFFSQEMPSRLDAVGDMLDRATSALVARHFLTREGASRLRLCLEEAVVNAVEHGNGRREDLSVRVALHDTGDRCLIRIYDRGCGFDPQNVRMSEPGDAGGRGVCLIRHFMDAVGYNRDEHCLELWLRRQETGPEEPSNEQ